MAAILGSIFGAKDILLGESAPTIDNWTFKLFYQWSTTLLLASCALVTSNQLFGDPIQCDLPAGGVSDDTLKSYCWMYSSFNIPRDFQGKCAKTIEKADELHNSYYQWIPLCLLGQAVLFYVPRAVWLTLEGGLMKHLAKDKQGIMISDGQEKCESLLSNYTRHLHNKFTRYFYAFFVCEILNVFIVMCQFMITDKFLNNNFFSYGPDVYRYYDIPENERDLPGVVNPMCETFPKVASCTYFRYGSGGRQEALQAICILALNIVTDKIYLVLWFWYVTLFCLGLLQILQRIFHCTSSDIRYLLIRLRMNRYFKDKENNMRIKKFLKRSSVGDWFVLYQTSRNINRRLFYMFIVELSKLPPGKEEGSISPFMKAVKKNKVVKAVKAVAGSGKSESDKKEDGKDKKEDKKKDEDNCPCVEKDDKKEEKKTANDDDNDAGDNGRRPRRKMDDDCEEVLVVRRRCEDSEEDVGRALLQENMTRSKAKNNLTKQGRKHSNQR